MNSAEILTSVIFYLCSAVIILSALLTILSKRIMYSLIFAIIVFFAVGFIFMLLNAEYNAIIQFAVYGVAIPILIAFALMFTSYKTDKSIYLAFSARLILTLISAILFVLTLFNILLISSSVVDWLFTSQSSLILNKYEMFNSISNGLYIKSFFALELIAFLVFVIIVGFSSLTLFKGKRNG